MLILKYLFSENWKWDENGKTKEKHIIKARINFKQKKKILPCYEIYEGWERTQKTLILNKLILQTQY